MMVRAALDQGAVATLLLSEGLRKRRVGWICKSCSNEWSQTQNSLTDIPQCPECGSDRIVEDPEKTMDLIDELTELASHTSAKVILVSLDTEEGSTLSTSFGGIAAMLRYAWS